MNLLDLIIAILLFFGAVRGFQKGFFLEAATLAALVAGIFFGLLIMDIVASILEALISSNILIIKIIVFLIIFGLVAAIIHFLGEVLTRLFKVMMLGLINRVAGMLLGILKWILLLAVAVVVLDFFNLSDDLLTTNLVSNSFFYSQMEKMNLIQFMANKIPQSIS